MQPAYLILPFAAAALTTLSAAAHPRQELRYDVVRSMFPPQSNWTQDLIALDFDGNGRPDAYHAGFGQDQDLLYRNDGTGVFTDETWRLPVESDAAGDAAAGDVDGNGSVDVVVGTTSGSDRLLLNWGGIFADESDGLPSDPHETHAVALGDVDGDGDLDLWLGNWGAQSRLYLNGGSGAFTDATGGIPAALEWVEDVALGDVDADGDLDAVIGVSRPCDDPGSQNRLYLNDGSGTFADATGQLPLDADRTMSVVLGDVDGDFDLDLVIGNASTCTSFGALNRLYLNDGAGLFADATPQLEQDLDNTRACALGDVDGDGDLDVAFASAPYNWPFTQGGWNHWVLNDGAGVFAAAALITYMPAQASTAVALPDVDGDGDLDMLVGTNGMDRLHLNDGSGSFALVEVGILAAPMEAIGLGDVDADGDLDALLTSYVAGTPLTPTVASQRLFHGDGAGYFAEVLYKLPDLHLSAIDAAFGDVDADGDLDVLLACSNDGDYGHPQLQDNVLYLNDGTGAFTDATDQLPTYIGDDRGLTRSVRLVDLDRDADLDAVFAEIDDYDGASQRIALYLNDGGGVFSESSDQIDYHGYGGAPFVEVGDVDGDGDADLVAGSDPGVIYLMLNDGSAHFADATAQMPTLPVVGVNTHLGLGDLDGDRDLDLVAGFAEWSMWEERNLLYLNDGAGFFTDASDQIPHLLDDYLLVDVDEDEDLDLFGTSQLLQNDGSGAFEVTAGLLPDGLSAPREIGDVDGDGDLDAFGAPFLWSNLTRHLAWRGLARIGKPLVLDVWGSAGAPWLLALAPAATPLELPPFGTLQLPPGRLALVGSGTLDASGRGARRFAIPADPRLVGDSVHWQALIGWPMRFTNREVTLVSDL